MRKLRKQEQGATKCLFNDRIPTLESNNQSEAQHRSPFKHRTQQVRRKETADRPSHRPAAQQLKFKALRLEQGSLNFQQEKVSHNFDLELVGQWIEKYMSLRESFLNQFKADREVHRLVSEGFVLLPQLLLRRSEDHPVRSKADSLLRTLKSHRFKKLRKKYPVVKLSNEFNELFKTIETIGYQNRIQNLGELFCSLQNQKNFVELNSLKVSKESRRLFKLRGLRCTHVSRTMANFQKTWGGFQRITKLTRRIEERMDELAEQVHGG